MTCWGSRSAWGVGVGAGMGWLGEHSDLAPQRFRTGWAPPSRSRFTRVHCEPQGAISPWSRGWGLQQVQARVTLVQAGVGPTDPGCAHTCTSVCMK